MLLFYAAHHHAKISRLDHDTDTLRLNDLLDGFGNLSRQALLNLQAAGENLDEARNFAQPDNLTIRYVGDVHLAEERQHVMLTEAEDLDVFHNHHLVISDRKQRDRKSVV